MVDKVSDRSAELYLCVSCVESYVGHTAVIFGSLCDRATNFGVL